MFSIKIKDKVLNIPNKLSEVPLYKGIEIINIFKELKTPTYDEKIAIISSLTNIEPNIFINVAEKSIDQIFELIKPMFYKDDFLVFKTFLFNKELYGVIDFEKMTVLEFIDIELNMKHNNNFDSLPILLTIICRKIIKKNNNIRNILNNIKLRLLLKNIVPQIYKNYIVEEYNVDSQKNSYMFNTKMDAASAFGLYYQYIEFRNKLMSDFKNLFDRVDIPEEDKDQYDEVPIFKKPHDIEEDWGLYSTLCSISSSIMEIDYWKKKNVIEFLAHLTFLKDKYEQDMIMKQNQSLNYGR